MSHNESAMYHSSGCNFLRATAGDRRSTARVFRNSWTVIAPKVVSRNSEEINFGRY